MPTPLTNFTTLFEPKIIERGKAYFKSGDVLNLRNDYDNHWTAIVQGNERYRVEVELTKNAKNGDSNSDIFIDSLDCTCEYWDNCKHEVAVLLAMQNQLLTVKDIPTTQTSSLSEQLHSFDKQQLIEFIDYLSEKYQTLEQDWVIWANKHAHQADPSPQPPHYPSDDQVTKIIQQRINQILTLDTFNDWEEFVFDEQSQALENLLAEFANQPNYLQQIATTWIDVALSTYDDVYDEVNDTLMLCFGVLAKHCFGVENYQANWYQDFIPVTSQMDNDTIQQLSILADNWRQATLRNHYTSVASVERFWFDFLWSLNQQAEALHWLTQVIDTAIKFNHYELDSLLTFKWQVLAYLGQDSQDEMDKYLHLPKIRQLKIDNLLENAQFEQAIALVKDAIATSQNRNIVIDWHKLLLKIAQQTDNRQLIREQAEILAFYSAYIDTTAFEIWRQTFDNTTDNVTWQTVKNAKQQALLKAQNFITLAKFYQLEQQDSELVTLIKNLSDKYLVDTYAKFMAEQDMVWLIDFYRKSWQQRIDNLANRKEYQAFANEIARAMHQFPQGKTAWTASVQDWISQFSTKTATRGRKPALVEELSKIVTV